LEGLFAVIFIVIGIISSIMKQQQNQSKGRGGMQRQQGQYRHRPEKQLRHIPEQPRRTAMDMGKSYMPSPVTLEESEGIEAEDRSRTGSLNYVEQSQSPEGVCDEHPEHDRQTKKKSAAKIEALTGEESPSFEITEDNLVNSIIMAEILGPPRSMKRSIR
jgi:hypothetical protein